MDFANKKCYNFYKLFLPMPFFNANNAFLLLLTFLNILDVDCVALGVVLRIALVNNSIISLNFLVSTLELLRVLYTCCVISNALPS